MAISTLTPFPNPPLLGQTQAVFNANASATLGGMQQFITEQNTAIEGMNQNTIDITAIKTDTQAIKDGTQTIKDDVTVMFNIVQDVSNYEGDWVADYEDPILGVGYPSGASVTYTDGWIYYSKVTNNLAEPVSETSDANWYFTGRKDYVDTPIVFADSPYTAKHLDGIRANSIDGIIVINALATPILGDKFKVQTGDYASTNKITVNGNGASMTYRDDTDTFIDLFLNSLTWEFEFDGTVWRIR